MHDYVSKKKSRNDSIERAKRRTGIDIVNHRRKDYLHRKEQNAFRTIDPVMTKADQISLVANGVTKQTPANDVGKEGIVVGDGNRKSRRDSNAYYEEQTSNRLASSNFKLQ